MQVARQAYCRFVGGLLVLMLLVAGVLAQNVRASLQYRPLDPHYLSLTKVGQEPNVGPNMCCVKIKKVPCSNQSAFTCNLSPVTCNMGSQKTDDCGGGTTSPSCNTQEGANCNFETLSINLNQCTATGQQTSCTGCNPPANGSCAQCSYNTATTSTYASLCETGSTLCASQPDPSCP